MKTTIIKYRRPADSSKTDNYFSLVNLGLVDKIVFERELIDSIPIFREEWSEQEDIQQIKTGYFDLVLPLSSDERSIAGRNLNDFFFEPTYNFNKLKFLVVVETDNPDRNYSGFINTSTVENDKTIIDGKYQLTFSVTGIDQEAVDWMKQVLIKQLPDSSTYDLFESQYLPYWMFKDVNLGDRLRLDNRLNLEGRIGKTLYVNKNLEKGFFIGGLNRGYSVWEGLKSLIKELGFRFKLKLRDLNNNFPQYDLILFWRSEGLNELDDLVITKYLTDKEAYYLSDNRFILVKSAVAVSPPSGFDVFTGLLFSEDKMYYTGLEYELSLFTLNLNTNILTVANNLQIILEVKYERVAVIENAPHAQDIYRDPQTAYNMPFAKIINYVVYPDRWHNYEDVLKFTAGIEYKYLLEGAKKIQKIKVKVPDNSNLALSTRATIKNQVYVCDRINSFDTYNKTMETEWIQI